MEEHLTGESLANLLKSLADRIQTNHTNTEGVLVELRQVAEQLEKRKKYGDV